MNYNSYVQIPPKQETNNSPMVQEELKKFQKRTIKLQK